MEITIKPVEKVEGQARVLEDSAIALRALLYSTLTEDVVEIEGFPELENTLVVLNCLKELGGEFTKDGNKVRVRGKGLRGFVEPENVLDIGSAEDSAQLLAGLLAGQPFCTTLTGNGSLKRHSLKYLTEPLAEMGAFINGRSNGELLPLSIRGYDLLPINYTLSLANPHLKSALLTAALYSRGVTEITDLYQTHDHTERALRYLGADISTLGKHYVGLKAPARLTGGDFFIPGDITKAAYLIVAATLASQGQLFLQDVGVNPSRTAFLQVLGQMGAEIKIENEREYNCEPVADLLVKGGRNLKGTKVRATLLPRLKDELPALVVAALFARGDTVIQGISTLRQGIFDRLQNLFFELRKMGARINVLSDKLVIQGGVPLLGAQCNSHGDPEVSMALATAALFARSETVISRAEAAYPLYPGFYDALNKMVS